MIQRSRGWSMWPHSLPTYKVALILVDYPIIFDAKNYAVMAAVSAGIVVLSRIFTATWASCLPVDIPHISGHLHRSLQPRALLLCESRSQANRNDPRVGAQLIWGESWL